MLRDNEVLKKMIATGEERMSKLASQLLQNETFMGALQKTMSAALDVKATAERAAHTALSAMNIPRRYYRVCARSADARFSSDAVTTTVLGTDGAAA